MSSITSGIRTSFSGLAKATLLLMATLVVLLFSLPLFSQGNFGRILGTVTDQSGGVISGATVTVIDKDRGVARTLTTDDAGEYNAPTLIPGTYIVRAEAKGFKRLERQNVVLEVGKEIRVDLTVQPGEQVQTVTVTEAIPLVETTNATLGGTLNNTDINDMPLNGRNYQNLLNLRPGVMTQPGGSPWTQSTNNIRPDETAWMLDGVINANFADARPVANMPSPLTDGAVILPIDAIQEFNLEENAKAEYGWKPGAVVNVGIRSGTNNLHGSAYAFGRDQSLDARNLFNPAPDASGNCGQASCDKLPTQLEQFGGVVGGPIKKDKLFFFAGYEGLRSTIGNAFGTSVPATASGLGPKRSMVDAIRALQNATPAIPVSPVSLALLGCPTGTLTTASTCTGGVIQGASPNSTSYLSTFPNNNVSDNGIAKIDYRINDKHMINGMFWEGKYNGLGEDHAQVSSAFSIPIPITTRTAIGNWIWTASSSLVNEARFGYNYVNFYQDVGDGNILADGSGLTGGAGYPINTGVTAVGGLPDISINPFTFLGEWPNRPGGFINPYYDFVDSLSYLRGKHAFKFGGGFTHISVETITGNTARGRIDFKGGQTINSAFACSTSKTGSCSTALEDFFAGNATDGLLLSGQRFRTSIQWAYSAFAQDDWRVTSKLMLNLGLRYSYVTPFHEINDLFGNFDPNSTTGIVQQGQPSVGSSIVHPDRKDFSPRLGFAWDVTGKGTTVVRGGASIVYSTIPVGTFTAQLGLQDSTGTSIAADPAGACTSPVTPGVPCPQTFGGTNVLANATYSIKPANWNGLVFPTGGGISCTAKVPCNLLGIDPNLKAPYVASWNLGVQHAFANNLSLELSYVGNEGERLVLFRDINEINPATGVRPYAAQFPYLKFINEASNGAHSNYNSLQATLTKRLSHGLDFLAGYTYGHGLDNGSLNRFGTLPQDSTNPQLEYASSDFDVRNRFTLTAGYTIPGKKGYGQLLEGWKINSIVSVQTGQPWIAFDAGNNFSGSGDNSDRWDFFGNPADFKSGGSTSIPFCFVDPKTGLSCTQTSGVSGIVTQLPTTLYQKCTAVAPDAGTLAQGGCYVSGNSVLLPPAPGTFGTMGRNLFRDLGFKNVDFSIFKNFAFKERYNAQFRVEFFNIFNHPNISNPYGASNGYGGASGGTNDMSTSSTFGCGCATPDVAAGNPLVGSGGSRAIQLGLKVTF
jgi:carboxypeptidase family protein